MPDVALLPGLLQDTGAFDLPRIHWKKHHRFPPGERRLKESVVCYWQGAPRGGYWRKLRAKHLTERGRSFKSVTGNILCTGNISCLNASWHRPKQHLCSERCHLYGHADRGGCCSGAGCGDKGHVLGDGSGTGGCNV